MAYNGQRVDDPNKLITRGVRTYLKYAHRAAAGNGVSEEEHRELIDATELLNRFRAENLLDCVLMLHASGVNLIPPVDDYSARAESEFQRAEAARGTTVRPALAKLAEQYPGGVPNDVMRARGLL